MLFGGSRPVLEYIVASVQGNIDYATLDLGYDFFRGPGYKLGAFVGYNFYRENKSAYGCTQIANPLSDCVPAIPSSVLVITEDDTWQSLRVGVNGQVMITDQFKLGADVAYLPYVKFNGTDDHVLRALVSPEVGHGEGCTSKAFSPTWSPTSSPWASAGVTGLCGRRRTQLLNSPARPVLARRSPPDRPIRCLPPGRLSFR